MTDKTLLNNGSEGNEIKVKGLKVSGKEATIGTIGTKTIIILAELISLIPILALWRHLTHG